MVPSVTINLADSLKRPAIGGGQASAGAEAGSAGGVERGGVGVVGVVGGVGAVAAEEEAEGADGDVFVTASNAAGAEA